jgi:hypothetical protein
MGAVPVALHAKLATHLDIRACSTYWLLVKIGDW